MRKLLFNFTLVFTMMLTSLWATDNPRAVIIFDASGSMWGQINGVTKVEIARDALKNVVRDWNSNVELGLTVYGHRSKGDCDDIETTIPVGKVDKNRVISTVMDIQPKGKTPISRSLKKVAQEIKYTEEKATIILISDGKETCDPDPCGTAKELEKQGIDFVTHVVGFNVDKETDEQLQCIANATGGEYFSAKNAAALNEAIQVIAKKVEVIKLEPKPEPVANKLKNNLEASASEKEGGKWVKAYHRIYKVENGQKGDSQLTSVNSTKKDAGMTKLPVGHYLLQSEYNKFIQQTPFEIKAGEVTKVHAIMGQTGKVELSASESEGGKWIEAYHKIYDLDGTRVTSCSSRKKKPCTEQIPVGSYILKSTYNDFKKEIPFEIKAGETTKLQVIFGQFSIGAKCSDARAKVSYEVYASNGQLIYEKKMRCSDIWKMTLDDGDYSVEAKIDSGAVEAKFSVGSAHQDSLILDLTNLNHEDEIKADNQSTATSQKIIVEDNKIEIKGLSQEDTQKIKEIGAVLGALGGVAQGANQSVNKESNAQTDKEFDKMSQELNMYTE
jgi:Ca-activated chloride channel family protein